MLAARGKRVNARVAAGSGSSLWRCEMTNGEQKVLVRGVAAGTIMGVTIGLMLALFIAMKPELFAGLLR